MPAVIRRSGAWRLPAWRDIWTTRVPAKHCRKSPPMTPIRCCVKQPACVSRSSSLRHLVHDGVDARGAQVAPRGIELDQIADRSDQHTMKLIGIDGHMLHAGIDAQLRHLGTHALGVIAVAE